MTKKKLEKIILVEVPTIIYPDLIKTFIHLFESSGLYSIYASASSSKYLYPSKTTKSSSLIAMDSKYSLGSEQFPIHFPL